uniref:C2H2-type domain-containing protein n=1 Tax=Timema bartmani TaxID=61472 RepID=A0A7R9EME7_9NEOP|nr:unnamed protein product [Timema bartmani]
MTVESGNLPYLTAQCVVGSSSPSWISSQHISRYIWGSLKCPVCDEVCVGLEILAVHLDEHHGDQEMTVSENSLLTNVAKSTVSSEESVNISCGDVRSQVIEDQTIVLPDVGKERITVDKSVNGGKNTGGTENLDMGIGEDIRETLLREGQADWEESTTGRRTFQLFPNVQERLRMKHLQPCQGLVHYITGHGPYRTSLFRMNLSETRLCCCGGEVTPEHVTLECIFTKRERAELLVPIQANAIYQILRDVDRWSYLDEIAYRVSKAERDRHMDKLKERRQRQSQDLRQNGLEETTEEEVTRETEKEKKHQT